MSSTAVSADTTPPGLSPSSSRCASTVTLQITHNTHSAAHLQCIAKRTDRAGLPTIRLLLIWFGANDSCLPGTFQHVPLPLFSSNLAKMIQLVSAPASDRYSPETKILLLTPPPVNTHQRGAALAARDPPIPLDRAFDVTARYADAVREVGRTEGVPVVDVYTRLWEGCGKDESKLSKYLRDGLHVNEEAYIVRVSFEPCGSEQLLIRMLAHLQGHPRGYQKTLSRASA